MRFSTWMGFATLALVASGCGGSETGPNTEPDSSVVSVVARGLTFEAPNEIPSGWTTFRFQNETAMVHFALVQRLPDGMGVREQQKQVAPVFQAGMDLLSAGRTDDAMAKFGELPEWFGQIVPLGGPGLTAPGRISEATMYLEPGTYMMECYVKTDGVFHSFNPDTSSYGMVHEFTVTELVSPLPEPEATIEMALSSERGIEVSGELTPGDHVVAVYFEDQKVHENFVGNDVHLVRLTDYTDLIVLGAWMDWSQETGLQTPAPAMFVGGLNEMPAGSTGYFKVSLEPGHYAWVAEVTNPAKKNMLKVFTVVDAGGPS